MPHLPDFPEHPDYAWIQEQAALRARMTPRERLILQGWTETYLQPENVLDTRTLLAEDTTAYTATKWAPRSDGFPVLYPNSHTTIYGPPGTGKTLLSAYFAGQVIRQGGRVLHVDTDDNYAAVIAQNIYACSGVSVDTISDRLSIAQPNSKTEIDQLAPWAILCEFDLIIIDSVASIEAYAGSEENSATDYVGRVFLGVIKPLKESGATIISIDHTTKAGATRGPSGSVQKQAKADVALLLETGSQQFGRGLDGTAFVYVEKDRPGSLYAATVKVDKTERDLLATFHIPPTGLRDATLTAPIGSTNPNVTV